MGFMVPLIVPHAHPRERAAVDREHRAGDERGVVGGEVAGELRHFLRRPIRLISCGPSIARSSAAGSSAMSMNARLRGVSITPGAKQLHLIGARSTAVTFVSWITPPFVVQ